ncbi:MAG: PAS domain S-box protein [Anaerolineae bacterium]|nr:PAS domain S-box protein [Anaerolineae bacterium]
MSFPDMKTVIFTYAVSNAACAGFVARLWIQNRRRFAGLDFWLGGFVMQWIAIVMIALRDVVPDFISIVFSNTLLVVGAILLYMGLERFTGKRGPQIQNTILLAAFVLIHAYFTVMRPSLMARNINISLGLIVIFTQCAWLLLFRAETEMRAITHNVGMILVAFCLVSLARTMLELVVPPENDFFHSNTFETLVVLTYQMLFIILTFGISLMVNRRLLTDQEHDIAMRRQAEKALRLSEEKFAKAFQASPDAILITRLSDGKIVEINESFCQLSEYSREEALNSSTIALSLWVNSQDRERCTTDLQENHRAHNYTYDFRTRSGKVLHCLYSGELIDLNDQVHVLSVIRDITARKEAEDNAARGHKLLASTLDALPVGICLTDKSGHYRILNKAYCAIYEYDRDEMLGQHYSVIMPPDQVAVANKQYAQLLNGDVGIPKERKRQRKDGSIIYIEAANALVEDLDGQKMVITTVRDITERKQTEQILREKTEELDRFFSLALDLLCIADTDGYFRRLNQSWETVLGYSLADMESRHFLDFVHPDDMAATLAAIEELSMGQTVLNFVNRYRCKDGSYRWIEWRSTPSDKFIYAAARDITEREQTERELRNLNQRFELYLKYIPIMMYMKDTETHAIVLSQQFEQILGKPLQELLGKTNAELWPPELATTMTQDDKRILNGDQAVIVEEAFAGRYYYSVKFPIKEPGQPPLLGGYTMDISDLKQTQAALQESEAKMRQITGAMRQAVWLRDTQTPEVLYVNPAYEEIWGRTCASLVADPTSFFQAVHPDDRNRVMAAIKGQDQGNFFNQEYRIIRPDGDVRWIWGRTFPITNEADEIYRVLAVAEDITARKQMEEALRQAKEAAEAANRAKSAFLANISHELRTPLNAVLGFSELMLRAPNLTPEQRENINLIGRSGEHLLGLINGVLNLSKIETGHAELHQEVFDLHEMLRDLNEIVQLNAEQKGIATRFILAPHTPRYIYTDAGKLHEVLINLLGNAVKFTERGNITMRVELRGSAPQSPTSVWLHFEIEDTGIGIAPDELDMVFEAFVQTESGRRSRQGTGLGLPISREYVRLMGGDLTVQSKPGAGSIFAFDIQVEVVETETESDGVLANRRIIGAEPGQPVYRVLIAEDDPANRKLLKMVLAPLSLDIREANNGIEAVEIWESWQPHLIFMDMRMPEMDGLEATQKIKSKIQSRPSEIQTVIVALTASAFEEERNEFLTAGCDDFVRKPFHETAIFEILARHLGMQYRYTAPKSQEESAKGIHQKKKREQIAMQMVTLDPEWKAKMEQAVVEGDMEWMETLVAKIQDQAPALAGQLAQLIYNFEHDEILKLIRSDLENGR